MRWRPQPVPFGLGRRRGPSTRLRRPQSRAPHPVPEPGAKAQLCRKISELTSDPVPPAATVGVVVSRRLRGRQGGRRAQDEPCAGRRRPARRAAGPADAAGRGRTATAVPAPAAPGPLSVAEALLSGAAELAQQMGREVPRRVRTMLRGRGGAAAPRPPSMLRDQPKLPWRGPLTPGRSFSWVSVPLDDGQVDRAHDLRDRERRGVRRRRRGDPRVSPSPRACRPSGRSSRTSRRRCAAKPTGRLWGTTATSRTVALPTHIADPLERLHESQAQTKPSGSASTAGRCSGRSGSTLHRRSCCDRCCGSPG